MLDVNGRAVVALAHQFGRRQSARGGGGIALFSSLVAFDGEPNATNYGATRAYAGGAGPDLAALPGLLSKLLEWTLAFLPRRGRGWMIGKVMSGMARAGDAA